MIFVDTGAWAALAASDDEHAEEARRLYADLSRGAHGALVTTDFVLDETATLIRMHADVPAAARLVRGILSSRSVTLVHVDRDQLLRALELFEAHPDKRWSFTDCTSFVAMQLLGIRQAFAFDRNFEQAGFERLP